MPTTISPDRKLKIQYGFSPKPARPKKQAFTADDPDPSPSLTPSPQTHSPGSRLNKK